MPYSRDINAKNTKAGRHWFETFHIVIVMLVIANLIFDKISVYSLHVMIANVMKLLLLVSGFILFFWHSGKLNSRWYYALYVFAPLLVILSMAIDGFLAAGILSIFLIVFWMPVEKKKAGDYVIVTPYTDLLNGRDVYQIKQNKYLVLQQYRGKFELSSLDLQNASFSVKGDSAFITFKKMEGDPAREVITTVGVRLQ